MDNKSQLNSVPGKKSSLPEKLKKPFAFGIQYEKYSEIYDMLVEKDSDLRATQEALENWDILSRGTGARRHWDTRIITDWDSSQKSNSYALGQ